MKHLFQTSLFKQILLVILASLTLSSPALSSIKKAQAQNLCGVYSNDTEIVVQAVRQSLNSNDLNKIIGCSALALSLGNETADFEAGTALLEIYNFNSEVKSFILDLLYSVARDAALFDERYYPGILFSLLFQQDFDELTPEIQQKYSTRLWVLIGVLGRDPETEAFSYYLAAQAFYKGQVVEQNFNTARVSFDKSITAFEKQFQNFPNDISMSRAKFCWLTVGAMRATSFLDLKKGISECFKTFQSGTNDLGALQIATGAITVSASLSGFDGFEGFWKQNYDFLEQDGMTANKAHKYLKKRCKVRLEYCDLETFFSTVKSSTTIYETSFASASLKHRVLIQLSLKNAGLYSGKIDGLWGNQTRTAVQSFSSNTNTPTFEVDRFDQKLLGSYPATDRDINMSIAKIHERAKGKRIRNYASNYQIIELDVPKRIFRLDPELDPLSARSRVGLSNSTSIMHRGRLITCNTVGIFTQCF